MNPNNVTVAGQAVAEAALRDQAPMLQTCQETARLRDAFLRARKLHQFHPDPDGKRGSGAAGHIKTVARLLALQMNKGAP